MRRSSVERYVQKEPGRLICDLMMSTHYSLSLQASTSVGNGPSVDIDFWTPIAEPDPPPVPFAKVSDDAPLTNNEVTIIVLAQPLRYSTGNITDYYLKLATFQEVEDYQKM